MMQSTYPPKKPTISILSYDLSSNSENTNSRPRLIYQAIKEWRPDADIKIYCSAFNHIKKTYIDFDEPDFIPLPVTPYYRNLSVQRVLSYNVFAWRLLEKFRLRESDLIIVCVPTNAPLLVALIYKLFFKIPVAIDVVDIWPEALPMPSKLKVIANYLIKWTIKPLRTWIYTKADSITTQSYYFRRKLELTSSQCQVLPMSSVHQTSQYRPLSSDFSIKDQIRLVYLGSINYIIDLDSLINLVTKLSKFRSVHLTVIGGGEKLDYLKEALAKINITTTFYGICFDSSIKNKELSSAHFGYNGYVGSTEVAFSYKSLEYFASSLPLLNSAKGDTYELIETHQCGLNFNKDTIDHLVENILKIDDETHEQMRIKTANVFNNTLSWPVFTRNVTEKLSHLLHIDTMDQIEPSLTRK
jgi:glycosyltransferase involved in cell wall biosynthesis